MKPRLYLETTIPSYLTAWPSRDLIVSAHQQITREWWLTRRNAFDVYVSQFVLDAAAGGDRDAARERLELLKAFPSSEISEAVLPLSSALIESGMIPAKAARDASHIAISAVHGIDYLMTWNCAQLANAMLVKVVQRVCEQNGFVCPVICTPEELLEVAP